MKVALYAGMYVKNQDGATKTLYQLTDSMLANSIEVAVWAFSLTPQKKPGFSLFKISGLPLILDLDYKVAFPMPKLNIQLNKFKPDIIHIAAPDLVGAFLINYARVKKIPLIMSYHTDFPAYLETYKMSFLKKTLWKYFKWFYNKGESVFAPTEEVQQTLKKKGIKSIKIWSRGIDTGMFNPTFRSSDLREKWAAKDKKIILYSGRFVWYKDLKVFIDVYHRFKNKNQVKFVLLGSGPIEEELRNRMSKAIFPGYLNGKALSEAYASSDILLFPSTTETFGNVIQESLSCGTPAIVSDIGGCQEIINNSGGGLIAKAKDADSFYDCCSKLLSDEKLFRQLRNNGLNYFKDRTWDKINQKVIAEYFRVINNNKQK